VFGDAGAPFGQNVMSGSMMLSVLSATMSNAIAT
jgi:hypothetical protein